ncbi:MAG: hypothetical protein SVV80_09990 [Planctomycetota bacterium]|nr:hypothetical protein [Planctomycetota bacterium]
MRLIFSIALLAMPIAAAGQSTQPVTTAPSGSVKLGPRYTDRLVGFSLCPPTDTDRIRQTSTRRLVGWARRDTQTDAVRWSLEVLRTKHKPTDLLLSEYAQAIAAELSRTGNFKVESTQISVVAGKPAMHFSGTWTAAFELWQRQTWVRTKPGEHLVLNISGAPTARAEMDAVITAVLDSLTLFDPKIATAEYKQNLAQGSAVLENMSVAKLQTIISRHPYYCLIKLKGKIIGFIQLTESITKQQDTQGLNVVSSGALILPDTPMQLTYKTLFAAPDRNFEQWKQVSIQGRGKTASVEIRDAIKKDTMLLVQVNRPGVHRQSWKCEVPETIRSAYLPEAFSATLPRLLDRSKAETYAFAVYNPEKNDFDMRTVRVVGTETIRIGAKSVKATHLTNQMSQQAPTANLWVDEKGMILRMQTPGGLTMEQSDRKEISARFAAELVELDKLSSRAKRK